MAEIKPVNDPTEAGHDRVGPGKRMSGWLIALIALLALFLACCVCLFLVGWLLGPALEDTFSAILATVEAATPRP